MTEFMAFIDSVGNLAFVAVVAGLLGSRISSLRKPSLLTLTMGSGAALICSYLVSVAYIYKAWGIEWAIAIAFSGPVAIATGFFIAGLAWTLKAAFIPMLYLIVGIIGFSLKLRIEEEDTES